MKESPNRQLLAYACGIACCDIVCGSWSTSSSSFLSCCLVYSGLDTHSGSDSDLEGPDYTFYITPADHERVITVESRPSNGSEFDVSNLIHV